MRTVIQRVSSSSVVIDGVCHGEIGRGMNVLIGIEDGDTDEDIEWLLRIHQKRQPALIHKSRPAGNFHSLVRKISTKIGKYFGEAR